MQLDKFVFNYLKITALFSLVAITSQNGEYKTFDQPMEGMYFRRSRRSPNGEDVLYVFYSPSQGRLALSITI